MKRRRYDGSERKLQEFEKVERRRTEKKGDCWASKICKNGKQAPGFLKRNWEEDAGFRRDGD